jgi:hypothetical protein
MTLEQWLRQATGDFPAGVQARLAQEYRTHLDESVATGGPADPVTLFGEPGAVKKGLRRSYLTDEQWRERRVAPEPPLWLMLLGGLYCVSRLHLHWPLLLAVYAAVLATWHLILTRSAGLPAVRRGSVRRAALVGLYLLVTVLLWRPGYWPDQAQALLALALLPLLVRAMRAEDVRLRRMLALEQPA